MARWTLTDDSSKDYGVAPQQGREVAKDTDMRDIRFGSCENLFQSEIIK